MKFTPATGPKLKFGTIWFLGKSLFPWQTENHKINKKDTNFMRIRFDV